MKQGKTGILLVLAAAMLWGTTGTSQALAPSDASPMAIGALRLLVGGLAMVILALAGGGLRRGEWQWKTTFLAAFFVAAYQVTFFAAVKLTGVAVGTMVGIGSSPVIAGVLGLVFRGDRPGGRWVAATVLAVAGCSLLSAGGDVSANPLGVLLALGAGLSYASYTLAIKILLEKGEPDRVMAGVFCCGALLLSPLLFTANLGWLFTTRGIIVVLHLGVIATTLSYWLFTRGLRQVPVATAVTLSLAEPLTATLLGTLLLGERLTALASCGVLLLFGGLAVLASGKRE